MDYTDADNGRVLQYPNKDAFPGDNDGDRRIKMYTAMDTGLSYVYFPDGAGNQYRPIDGVKTPQNPYAV